MKNTELMKSKRLAGLLAVVLCTLLLFGMTSALAIGSVNITSLTASKTTASIGDTITFTTSITATANYYLRYQIYYKANAAATGTLVLETGSYSKTTSYAVTKSGIYYGRVEAYNFDTSAYESEQYSAYVTVNDSIQFQYVYVDQTSASVGETLVYTPSVIGGTGSYTYSYYIYCNNLLIATSINTTAKSFSYTTSSGGTYFAGVYAWDSSNSTKYVTSPVTEVYAALQITSVTASERVVEIGTSVTYTANVKGGSGTYSQYLFTVSNGTSIVAMKTSTTNSFTFSSTVVGDYTLELTVTDSSGLRVTGAGDSISVIQPLALTAVNVSTNGMSVGGTLIVQPEFTGKPTYFIYKYYRDNALVSQVQKDYVTTTNFDTYSPTNPGTYYIQVMMVAVTLNGRKTFSADSINVTVNNQLEVTNLMASPTKLTAGATVTFTTTALYGTGDRSYIYKVYKDSTLYTIVDSTSSTFQFAPTEAGAYYVVVYVKDAISAAYVTATSPTVTVYSKFYITSVTPSITSGVVGTPITFATSVSGGSGNYKYIYNIFYNGAQIGQETYYDSLYTYTPPVKGNFWLDVYVTNLDNGLIVYKRSSSITVSAGLSNAYLSIQDNKKITAVNEPVILKATCTGTQQYIIYRVFNGSGTKVYEGAQPATFYYSNSIAGTYTAVALFSDGVNLLQSNSVSFKVVNAMAISSITISDGPYYVGDTVTFTPVVPASGESGAPSGTPQYIYCIFRNGAQIGQEGYETTAFNFSLPATGSYHLVVYAKDDTGYVIMKKSASITVVAAPQMRITSVTCTTTPVNINDPIGFTTTISGGTAPYYYVYNMYNDTTLIYNGAVSSSLKSDKMSYRAYYVGSYTLNTTVYDSAGNSATLTSAAVNLKSYDPLVISSVTPSSTTPAPGSDVTFTTAFEGGVPNASYIISYVVYRNGLSVSSDSKSLPSGSFGDAWIYTPTTTGTYSVKVSLTDGTSTVSRTSTDVVVTQSVPSITSITLGTLQPEVGNSVSCTVTATSGTIPYQYKFVVYRSDGSVAAETDFSATNPYSYTTTSTGYFYFAVTVKDANNVTAYKESSQFQVVASNTDAPSLMSAGFTMSMSGEPTDDTTGSTDGTTGSTDGTTGSTDGTTGSTDGTTGLTDETTESTEGTTESTETTETPTETTETTPDGTGDALES